MIFDVVQLFVKKERQCVLLKRFNLKSVKYKKKIQKKIKRHGGEYLYSVILSDGL